MDIHMAMGIHMVMTIRMAKDIPMDMAIHITMEMIMTTAMVLVIWASLLTKKVPEDIPKHYKPAAQDYELPLSAQFGTPSPYTYQYSEQTTAIEPPPVYEGENQDNGDVEDKLVVETN